MQKIWWKFIENDLRRNKKIENIKRVDWKWKESK